METTIITILVVAVLLLGFEIYRAHKNHTTVQNQAKEDLAAVEADVKDEIAKVEAEAKTEIEALKSEVAKLREHIAATTGSTVGNAPAPTPAPAPAPVAPAPSGTGQAST